MSAVCRPIGKLTVHDSRSTTHDLRHQSRTKGKSPMAKLSIQDIELTNKRLFIRVDFNVPLTEDGTTITDDTRIVATLPTIEYALRHRAKVILASHLGRPKGKPNPKYSLKPVVTRLRELLDKKLGEGVNVAFSPDCVGEIAEEMARQLESGQVLLLENLRFHAEEEANDPAFAKQLAALAEVYVNDAFGSAHRAHASTEGITHYLKPAVAGLLMEKEITYLGKALENPEKPFVAIIGGSKISGKIDVIQNLLDKVNTLVIVGGMAYTFYRALGVKTAKSLVEEDKIEMAKDALAKAKAKGVKLLLPVDNILADNFAADAKTQAWDSSKDFPEGWQGLDIGPKSVKAIEDVVSTAKTIVWNGPAGVFEFPRFAVGTNAIARAVAANRTATSIIGGGDSVSAINQAGVADEITHISTGGGASLEFLEGKKLPGVEALTNK
ncbi:MAG TPA: phosphoglycerate kinase [Terracidiphilus sp.]|nr:phosphoglycerate kinase [Terracidiphilus sp.]